MAIGGHWLTRVRHQYNSSGQRRNKRVKSDCGPVRLTSLSADIAVRCASYLASDDLLNLALTSKLYGAPAGMRRGFWSLSEEVARQRYETATASEKGGVPSRGGRPLWLKLLRRLEVHRVPLRFDHLLGSAMGTGEIGYVDGDMSSVFFGEVRSIGASDCTVISNFVMTDGKHYAMFRINGIGLDDSGLQCIRIGIMTPVYVVGWDEDRRRNYSPFCQSDGADGSTTCCVYDAMDGDCTYLENGSDDLEYLAWDGMESIAGERDVAIGLLLDLDNGTLAVFKNGRRLGIMKNGLAGAFCWMAYLRKWVGTCKLAIERGELP